MIPTDDEVADMIDGISLSPGGVFELPYGYKMESFEPKDEPQNFEKALRWNLMAVCAAVGVPPHEVTGDWNSLPERMARYVGQSMGNCSRGWLKRGCGGIGDLIHVEHAASSPFQAE